MGSEDNTESVEPTFQQLRCRSHFINWDNSLPPSKVDYPIKKPRNTEPTVDPEALVKMVESQLIRCNPLKWLQYIDQTLFKSVTFALTKSLKPILRSSLYVESPRKHFYAWPQLWGDNTVDRAATWNLPRDFFIHAILRVRVMAERYSTFLRLIKPRSTSYGHGWSTGRYYLSSTLLNWVLLFSNFVWLE